MPCIRHSYFNFCQTTKVCQPAFHQQGASPFGNEFGSHSDLKLKMKNYTDVGRLPLREVMESLPGFGGKTDSRIDSQTLGASGEVVSPSVTKNGGIKTENRIENSGESLRDSRLVAASHEDSRWRREGDSNLTILHANKGESHGDSRIDSRNPITACPELSQVVTAWAKLPAPIKAAILALVKTAD